MWHTSQLFLSAIARNVPKRPCEKRSPRSNYANQGPGADPGFLERGFILYKGVVVRFADFISFFLNIP